MTDTLCPAKRKTSARLHFHDALLGVAAAHRRPGPDPMQPFSCFPCLSASILATGKVAAGCRSPVADAEFCGGACSALCSQHVHDHRDQQRESLREAVDGQGAGRAPRSHRAQPGRQFGRRPTDAIHLWPGRRRRGFLEPAPHRKDATFVQCSRKSWMLTFDTNLSCHVQGKVLSHRRAASLYSGGREKSRCSLHYSPLKVGSRI